MPLSWSCSFPRPSDISIFALQHGLRIKRRPATTQLHGTLLSGISGCADSLPCPNGRRKKPGLQGVAGWAREWSSGRKRDVAGVRRRHVQPSHSGLGGSGQPDVGAPNVLANTTERACRALRLRHSAIHSAAAAAYLRPPPPPSWPKSPLPCARPRGPHRHAVRPRTYVLTLSAFRAQ